MTRCSDSLHSPEILDSALAPNIALVFKRTRETFETAPLSFELCIICTYRWRKDSHPVAKDSNPTCEVFHPTSSKDDVSSSMFHRTPPHFPRLSLSLSLLGDRKLASVVFLPKGVNREIYDVYRAGQILLRQLRIFFFSFSLCTRCPLVSLIFSLSLSLFG